MFKSYLKIALRGLIKHKSYSLINILGLATGMAVALLIGLWVFHEYSYDRFLPDYERIYKVKRHYTVDGEVNTIDAISQPLVDILKHEIPGIERVAVTDYGGNTHSLVVGETKLYNLGSFVGPDFLQIFQYPLVQGNPLTALSTPNSIVLTQETATALFGEEDPMNQSVRMDNSQELTVTGILADLPANSSLQFDYLLPFRLMQITNSFVEEMRNSWFMNGFKLFVVLEPEVSYAQIAPKIETILMDNSPELRESKQTLSMQAMKDWHLYEEYENGEAVGGYIEYVRLFGTIGLLVLLIACINFMNLATARSEKRAKEVGVRKAIGSKRKHLITQFLSESLLLTVLSFCLALLLVYLALVPFNTLLGSEIAIPFNQPLFWLIMLVYIGFTALLAGSRPAFYLSSFNAVKVLKGAVQGTKSAVWGRKALVLLQFSCSIALIISTFIIYQQIQHVKNRPAGYNKDRLMMTDMSADLNDNYEAIKHELLQSGLVEDVTKASSPITTIYYFSNISNWPGKNPDKSGLEIGAISISDSYFETLGMELKSGRNFKGTREADTTTVILNESAVAQMNLTDPIGQTITWNRDQPVTVVGVVKDAIFLSPYTPVHPIIFTPENGYEGSIMYRLSDQVETREAIPQLAAIFDKHNPAYPYEYNFADDAYAAKFQLEILVGQLAGLFAGLAIFVSCLGLFGLAAYMAEQRRKEIGIRKVLGATVAQIWLLLSKEFLLLVFISCLLAMPIAFYFLQDWLADYDYRVDIGPGVFVFAVLLALLITIITISFQAIRAGLAQPVKSLRTE